MHLCRLANAVLKICLGHAPSRDSRDRLTSGLLMNGRLGAIELYYTSCDGGGGGGSGMHDQDTGSERFVIKSLSTDKFRSLVSDVDWTQLMTSASVPQQQRQGTFTLEDQVN